MNKFYEPFSINTRYLLLATRYSINNAALRMNNGVEIQAEEQRRLLTHSRAVTEAMSSEVNPVAESTEEQYQCSSVAKPVAITEQLALAESVESKPNSFFQEAQNDTLFIENPTAASPASTKELPQDEHGTATNPNAYKLWQPEPMKGEVGNFGQLKEKLTSVVNKLRMPKPQSKTERKVNALEELNQWLADPILRKEAMARVMRSERYTVEFDCEGNPYRVVEVR